MNLAPLHKLARRIAPELTGLVILSHPEGWPPVAPGTIAYVPRGRNLLLRQWLIERGLWGGIWPPCVVWVDPPKCEEDRLGVFLHELGHALPAENLPDLPCEPSPAEYGEQVAMLSSAVARQSVPWQGHDHQWLRFALHAWHRAGRTVSLDSLCLQTHPYQSPPWLSLSLLGDEPERMAGKSFAEIQATPAPADFIDCWQSGIDCFHHFQTSPK